MDAELLVELLAVPSGADGLHEDVLGREKGKLRREAQFRLCDSNRTGSDSSGASSG